MAVSTYLSIITLVREWHGHIYTTKRKIDS